MPDLGDRIAEEDDAALASSGRLERSIGLAIADKLAVVVGEHGDTRRTVLVETSEASGRDYGGGLLAAPGGQKKTHKGSDAGATWSGKSRCIGRIFTLGQIGYRRLGCGGRFGAKTHADDALQNRPGGKSR